MLHKNKFEKAKITNEDLRGLELFYQAEKFVLYDEEEADCGSTLQLGI